MTYEDTRKWVLGCIYHDGFVETKRGDRANKVIKEALEKQMPKKPNKATDSSWGITKEVNVCPCCDYYLGNFAFINIKDIAEHHKVTYCETCGQAIDWSDSE